MAHFAKIQDTKVVDIIVVNNDDCGGGVFPESEPIGQAFIASCNIGGDWQQCSYNGNFRNCYPGISYIFDPLLGEYGEFYLPPQPEPEPYPLPEPVE